MSECGTSGAHLVDLDDLVTSMKNKLNLQCSLHATIEKNKRHCLISRVPKNVRGVDRKAYEPIIWSVGPYHNGIAELLVMDKDKWNCLCYILALDSKRSLQDYLELIEEAESEARDCYAEELKMDSPDFIKMLLLDGCFLIVSLHGLDGLLDSAQDVLVRTCNSPEVLDETEQSWVNESRSAFPKSEIQIVESSRIEDADIVESNRNHEVELSEIRFSERGSQIHRIDDDNKDEHCQTKGSTDKTAQWLTTFLAHDLFLLENQIPFFVLRRIFELLTGSDAYPSLSDRIAAYVEIIFHCYPKEIQEWNRPQDFQHLLHLCHIYFRPSKRPLEEPLHESRHWRISYPFFFNWMYARLPYCGRHKQTISPDQHIDFSQPSWKSTRWRRAVQYHEAGIEFKKKGYEKNKPHSLLDIRFNNGITEIPCLIIDRNTGSLFRNLIAFEQTSPQFGNDFIAYIVFFSQLMSTPDDVMFLVKKGIIIHEMRFDEEVSALFSKLGKNVDFDHNSTNYLKSVSQAMEKHYQSRLNRWMAWLWHNHFSNPWLILAVIAAAVVLICTVVQSLVALLAYLEQSGSKTSLSGISNSA